MRINVRASILSYAAVALALFGAGSAMADDKSWTIAKASGDVWVMSEGAQQVALTSDTEIKHGDELRTGKTGRVLLTRGEETILVSPNTVLTLPKEGATGPETRILQKSGEIVLKVEKKNSPHFEVATPYLAALVKGTQFRVTVGAKGSHVDVLEGKVQVSDHKSGKFALVLPGQSAKVASFGNGGLKLSGQGQLSPIETGKPIAPGFGRVPVPKSGLKAPQSAGKSVAPKRIEARGGAIETKVKSSQVNTSTKAALAPKPQRSKLQIKTAIGEVKFDARAASRGVAQSGFSAPTSSGGKSAKVKDESTLAAVSTALSGAASGAAIVSSAGSSSGTVTLPGFSNSGGNGSSGSNSSANSNGNGSSSSNSNSNSNSKHDDNDNKNTSSSDDKRNNGNGNGNGNSNGKGNGGTTVSVDLDDDDTDHGNSGNGVSANVSGGRVVNSNTSVGNGVSNNVSTGLGFGASTTVRNGVTTNADTGVGVGLGLGLGASSNRSSNSNGNSNSGLGRAIRFGNRD